MSVATRNSVAIPEYPNDPEPGMSETTRIFNKERMNGAIIKIKKMFIQKIFFCFSPMNIKINPIHINTIFKRKKDQL